MTERASSGYLEPNRVYLGDNRHLLPLVEPESVALSVWSPPYFVGKSYEKDLSFGEWQELLATVIALHYPILRPGAFMAVNIGDILSFPDPSMPRLQADLVSGKRRSDITREAVLEVMARHPEWSKHQIARYLGCSEQTVDRRLKGNNARGGKHAVQTKVKLLGGLIVDWAERVGFYLYDRRIWVKDPAWANCRWHTASYRSVDEFEYIYIFWKPGVTKVDRNRLGRKEWAEWGSRGVWRIPSVRRNDDHEAKFPKELPLRLIRLFTEPGEVVLDPFLGSGTTAVAAVESGRRFIGMEKEERYYRLSLSNIQRALAKKGLFEEAP